MLRSSSTVSPHNHRLPLQNRRRLSLPCLAAPNLMRSWSDAAKTTADARCAARGVTQLHPVNASSPRRCGRQLRRQRIDRLRSTRLHLHPPARLGENGAVIAPLPRSDKSQPMQWSPRQSRGISPPTIGPAISILSVVREGVVTVVSPRAHGLAVTAETASGSFSDGGCGGPDWRIHSAEQT